MKEVSRGRVVLYDSGPEEEDFRAAVLRGLAAREKSLPCKFFYDERGSALFDRICELEDYYPTRTELGIMRRHAGAMARHLGPRCRLVELGSGSSTKSRILLDALESPARYVPIDISREHLVAAAQAVDGEYPDMLVEPVCADYTRPFTLPEPRKDVGRTAAYFPGSTIGNFTVDEARRFLTRIHAMLGTGGALLIGVDLVKDPAVLVRAYDDREGVTAEFNRNILHRIAGELGGSVDPEAFEHAAVWDPERERIEIRLVSTCEQGIVVDGRAFLFAAGEWITTEYSHKYTLPRFADLAGSTGFDVAEVWTDERDWFSVQLLEAR